MRGTSPRDHRIDTAGPSVRPCQSGLSASLGSWLFVPALPELGPWTATLSPARWRPAFGRPPSLTARACLAIGLLPLACLPPRNTRPGLSLVAAYPLSLLGSPLSAS
ncbi:protein of unknown function (plasmid) [Denitratisoma oestradiolicum]|uniref:Uncharacterized protein n=1 Tax=Denitratisoma oestradiolicum TaxID=311182 RepID=A0A6S6YV55_9PROT|nr:protein of unknown function [Denitratisoma oestradiolicum]